MCAGGRALGRLKAGNWVVVETRSKAEPSGLPAPGSAVEQAGGSKLPLAKAQCDTGKLKC